MKVQSKDKIVPELKYHAKKGIHCLIKHNNMKKCWSSGGILPCILNLGTRPGSVVSLKPWLFYPRGKILRYPLDRGL